MTSAMRSGLGLLLVAVAACTGDDSPPPTVHSDGSAARPPPVALQGVRGPSILTRARVLRAASVQSGSRVARCLRRTGAPPLAVVVERVGASGHTVTVLDRPGQTAHACDATAADAAWCGHAYGRLDAGRLRDPRLSLTCRTGADELLGFAWLQPDATTSYLVVARRGYSEVHPVTRRVPVRVVTDDVDEATSSATFSVSEHAKDGRLLSRYEVRARVSG